jgi:hypothetical protein
MKCESRYYHIKRDEIPPTAFNAAEPQKRLSTLYVVRTEYEVSIVWLFLLGQRECLSSSSGIALNSYKVWATDCVSPSSQQSLVCITIWIGGLGRVKVKSSHYIGFQNLEKRYGFSCTPYIGH